MASGDYYDVSAILAEETYVPARLVHGCTGGFPCDAFSVNATQGYSG